MPSCPCRNWTLPSVKTPAVMVCTGASFALLGSLPLAITMTTGAKSSSATLIGLGFVGFGIMIMLPGLCWCLWARRCSLCEWCKCQQQNMEQLKDDTSTLQRVVDLPEPDVEEG